MTVQKTERCNTLYNIKYQCNNGPAINTSCHGEIALCSNLDLYVLEFFSTADICNDNSLKYCDVEVKRANDNALVFKGRIHKTVGGNGEWDIDMDTMGFAKTFNNTVIRKK